MCCRVGGNIINTLEERREELSRKKDFSEAFTGQLEVLNSLAEDILQDGKRPSLCRLSGEAIGDKDAIVFLYVPYQDPDFPDIDYESIAAKKSVVERLATEHSWKFSGGTIPFTHWNKAVKIH